MKNLTKLSVLIITFASFQYSCNKEEVVQIQKFENVEYYSTNPKKEVLDFLKTTKYNPFPNTKLLEDYSDRELNEAKWILEAASNYLVNVNLDKKFSSKEEFTLSFNLFEENDQLKIEGSELSDKFDLLLQELYELEFNKNENVKIVDFELIEVSGLISDIKVTVYFGISAGGENGNLFPNYDVELFEAAQILQDSINMEIYNPFLNQWVQNVEIIAYFPGLQDPGYTIYCCLPSGDFFPHSDFNQIYTDAKNEIQLQLDYFQLPTNYPSNI